MGSETTPETTNGSAEEIFRIAEKKARGLEVMRMLAREGAIVTLRLPIIDPTTTMEVKHERDFIDDTERFNIKKIEPEDFGYEVGWIIPFKTEDDSIALALIDLDLNTSIHFISTNPAELRSFKENYADRFIPGNELDIYPEESKSIHTDYSIPYENKLLRLDVTNPEHTEKIKEYFGIALEQAKINVIKNRQARIHNSDNSAESLINFGKSLNGSPDTSE